MIGKKITWKFIIWKSLNEVMLIIGAIFIGFFFTNPLLLKNHWIIYGITLIIISVMSKIYLEAKNNS